MKGRNKKTALSFVMLLVFGFTGTSQAHTVSGTVAPGSTDVYNFQCFTDALPWSEGTQTALPANRASIRLVSASGAGVSAQLGHIRMAIPAAQNWVGQVTDLTTGASPVILAAPATKTAGTWSDHGYNLAVRNTSTLARIYNVEFHCLSGILHAGTGTLFTNSQTPTADFSTVINN
ncbi:MAG: hypothetical protein ABL933_10420 [Methyloglobulus sp.]|nr:hypothetical protein [Methyloglobulus sp.]